MEAKSTAQATAANTATASKKKVGGRPKGVVKSKDKSTKRTTSISQCDPEYRAKRDKNNAYVTRTRQKKKLIEDETKKENTELLAKNEQLKVRLEVLEREVETLNNLLESSSGSNQKGDD